MKKFITILLVCLMVVPFGILAGISMTADADTVVYLSDAGNDSNDGKSAANALKTITKAYQTIGDNNGTIVVTGTFTQSADFVAPEHAGKITIKGADESAVYTVSGKRFQSGGSLEFTDITINQTAANFMLVSCFHELTISETVKKEAALASFVVAGGQGGSSAKDRDYTVQDTTLTINAGYWSEVIGSVRNSLNSPAGAHAEDEFQNYTVTFNIGGSATVGKLSAFTRSYGACAIFAENSQAIVNLNGGKILAWAGMTDATTNAKTTKIGYENGVTFNIGKDFDITQSFTLDASKQVDNTVTDANGNKIFYGLNGDNVFVNDEYVTIGTSKVVAAPEVYDAVVASGRIRGMDIEKAAADVPETSEPVETTPETTEPAETEPAATEPAETEPAATEPAETEPAATEPAATEPAATEPAATEPAETEPAATEPAATEPAETEQPGNVPTGDTTYVVAVVAVVAAVACAAVVVLKKRENA